MAIPANTAQSRWSCSDAPKMSAEPFFVPGGYANGYRVVGRSLHDLTVEFLRDGRTIARLTLPRDLVADLRLVVT